VTMIEGEGGNEEEWVMAAPIDYTKVPTAGLILKKQEISDRLIDMGEPRPLLTGVPPTSDEAKDLHSQYGAIMFALYKRGIKDE